MTRHEAADTAWFEVRCTASIAIADVLPFDKWADRAAPFGCARPFPRLGHGAELDRWEGERGKHRTCHCGRVPLLRAAASGDCVPLHLRRSHRSAALVRRVLNMVAQLVRAAFVAMQLNKVTPWRLLKMFQTIFVGVSTLVMWCTFCFLWRNQPAKMAALTMGSPCSWMDIPRSAEGHLAHPLRALSSSSPSCGHRRQQDAGR